MFFSDTWLTFGDKDAKAQEKFCYDTLKLKFFMFDRIEPLIYNYLKNKDYLLSNGDEKKFKIISTGNQTTPYLTCTISNSKIFFYLFLNLNHEIYTMFPGKKSGCIGVVTQSYTYQQSSQEIREQIWQDLNAITSKI